MIYQSISIKNKLMDKNDNTASRALHIADLDMILDISYGPQSPIAVISDYEQ